MAGDVTLTASMRANLYSLQQTAQLMGTVQQRLATGKKVNSALDNPNNYFTAQSLSNRASDISSLLDGMGQAIQTIKAATQGIEGAQKLIDQMKAVANSALQTASSVASGARTQVTAGGTLDTQRLITEDDNTQLLTNLKNNTSGDSLGIVVGDTLTLQVGAAGTTATFTATETSTIKDVFDFIESNSGGNGSVTVASGIATVGTATNATLIIGGNIATNLDIDGTTSTSITSAVTVATGPAMLADLTTAGTADDTIALTSLTDDSGDSLGIALGDTLTMKLGDTGQTVTFTVGGDSSHNSTAGVNGGGITLKDLQTWMENQGDGTGDFQLVVSADTGKLKLHNESTAALGLTVGGKLAEAVGLNGTIASAGSAQSATAIYSLSQYGAPVVSSNTLLRDITSYNGSQITGGQTQIGDELYVKTSTGTTHIKFTEGMTIGDLMTQINAIDSKLSVSLDTSGHFVIDNQTAGTVTFASDEAVTTQFTLFDDGTNAAANIADSEISTNTPGNATTSTRAMYAGIKATGTGASGSGVIDSSKSSQFDTLRTQLNELVGDSSYQGTNLISSAANSPLTVTFNEKATGASKLVIQAVDLTTSGLSIKAATGDELGSWKNTDAVRDALANLTAAANTLRSQAATFGYNLSTVQNRQDFANNMIATLKEGADKLTLADMNEEGANMLALQTRSQLGTQSLSLASQANQAVMRLFG